MSRSTNSSTSLTGTVQNNVRRLNMDLLYIGAILAFGGISLAMLMGRDKLRRTSRDRGTH